MLRNTVRPVLFLLLVAVVIHTGIGPGMQRSILLFAGILLLSGALLVRDVHRPRTDRAAATDTPVTAIIPAYREEHTLHRSVESLLDVTYDDLAITVVCEPDDDATQDAAEQYTNREDVSLLINGSPGSKAGAINHAVRQADTDVFLVADADEVVDPSFLSAAMRYITDGYDVFQGRRIPEPTGLVESLCYCDRLMVYGFWAVLQRLRFPVPLSSSTVFTREAFDMVGGYNDVLTEDLDFAHLCYREDVAVAQRFNHSNTMEAPHTLQDYWGQRKRWQMGGVQVLHRALTGKYPHPWSFRGIRSTVQALLGVLGQVFLLVVAVQLVAVAAAGALGIAILPLVASMATVFAVSRRDRRDGKLPAFYMRTLLAPVAYPVNGLISLNALTTYVLPGTWDWYRVMKTGEKRNYTGTLFPSPLRSWLLSDTG